jgi:type VI secretion system protein ImpC
MPSRLQFDFQPTPTSRRRGSGPLRLLLLGDFSGRATSERHALAGRPTLRLDADSFDDVLARVAPRVRIGQGDEESHIEFGELDHFHPDALYSRVPLFATLRRMRQRLLDPAQYAQAAAELGVAPSAASAPAAGGAAGSGGDLLAGLLGGKPAGMTAAPPPAPAAGIDAFIRSIVAPHVVASVQPQQAQLVASVEAAIAAEMRTLLHTPALQALEAAWRGAMWLVSSLELDDDLQLHLLDVSKEELLADVVAAQGRLADTELHRVLADRWRNVPGGEPWQLLVGQYSFGPSDADIGLAAALGLLAAQAGGPLLAAADTALATAEPAALAGWMALRQSQAAPWLGLVAPRVLLRLPYGKRSDPISAFAFEEFPGGAPDHERLLWGAGSLAAALLIGRAYSARGWEFEPGDQSELGDLPAYTYTADGESQLQPCAEHLLGERAGQALLAAGLMPLMSHKHRNAATLMRFQSVAHPPQPLAGLGRT